MLEEMFQQANLHNCFCRLLVSEIDHIVCHVNDLVWFSVVTPLKQWGQVNDKASHAGFRDKRL
jgi:hypothetical protein